MDSTGELALKVVIDLNARYRMEDSKDQISST